ncbi:MAG: DUF1080 domain-containing protein, partial [Bacteroidales bacterium]|nr:DUF1080 domain-containing protein [Bacteroidales bacterium]
MRKTIFLPVFLLLAVSCGTKTNKADSGEWIQLFNGRDLSGWIIKIKGSPMDVNYKNTFRVEDGIMKVCYDEYEKFNAEYGHIFYRQP